MIQIKKSLFLSIICILLVLTIHNVSLINNQFKAITFSNAYETMDIHYDDFSQQITDIDDLSENRITGVIYFGRDTCQNCLQVNSILKDLVAKHGYSIYKFDTDEWRSKEDYEYILEKYQINSIPIIIKTDENGELIQKIEFDGLNSEDIQKVLNDFFENNPISTTD